MGGSRAECIPSYIKIYLKAKLYFPPVLVEGY